MSGNQHHRRVFRLTLVPLALLLGGAAECDGISTAPFNPSPCPVNLDDDEHAPLTVRVLTDYQRPVPDAIVTIRDSDGEYAEETDIDGFAQFCRIAGGLRTVEIQRTENSQIHIRMKDVRTDITDEFGQPYNAMTVYLDFEDALENYRLDNRCPDDVLDDDLLLYGVQVVGSGFPDTLGDFRNTYGFVEGAVVEIRGTETWGPQTTDALGATFFCNIPAGRYVLRTSLNGTTQERQAELQFGIDGVISWVYFTPQQHETVSNTQ